MSSNDDISTMAPTVKSTGTWTTGDTLITCVVAVLAFSMIVLFVYLNNLPTEKKEKGKSFTSQHQSGAEDSLHSVDSVFERSGPTVMEVPDMQKFPLHSDEESSLLGEKKQKVSKKTGEPWPPSQKV